MESWSLTTCKGTSTSGRSEPPSWWIRKEKFSTWSRGTARWIRTALWPFAPICTNLKARTLASGVYRSADTQRNRHPPLQRRTAAGVNSARDVAAAVNQGEDPYEKAYGGHEQEQNPVA